MYKLRLIPTGLIFILFLIISCNQSNNTDTKTEEAVEEMAEEVMEEEVIQENSAPEEAVAERILSSADSTILNNYIKELKGIDKFFVTNSYKRLLKLLEHKKDPKSEEVSALLEGIKINEPNYIIGLYEPENGYLLYEPGMVEVMVDMVYWNVSDGSQLIATQSRACGPLCDFEISFKSFKNDTYTKLENKDVLPNTSLREVLLPDHDFDDPKGDPVELYFKLPRKGKDLKFCQEENCLTLKWMDGKFELE